MIARDLRWDVVARDLRQAFDEGVAAVQKSVGPIRHRVDQHHSSGFPLWSALCFLPSSPDDEEVVVEVIFEGTDAVHASGHVAYESGEVLLELPSVHVANDCSLRQAQVLLRRFVESIGRLVSQRADFIGSLVVARPMLPSGRKESTAKDQTLRRPPAKPAPVKKATAKKATAKKATAKKATAKKATAKKATAKKATAKKATAKKATSK